MNYIANTNGQLLSEHLRTVSIVSGLVYESLFNGRLKKECELAGLLHDIGKADPDFQKWCIKKVKSKTPADCQYHNESSEKKFEDINRHNELSWAILNLMGDIPEEVKYAVLWHHAEKFRKHPIKGANQIYKTSSYTNCIENLTNLFSELSLSDNFKKQSNIVIPEFKEIYKTSNGLSCDYNQNLKNTVVRLCLIVADRLVSGLPNDELRQIIKTNTYCLDINDEHNKLKDNINNMLSDFGNTDRCKKQNKAARECAENNISILQGPAGVGKTKVSLEWAKNIGASRIIYMCPTTAICYGIYTDLRIEYLPNITTQIFTGNYKYSSLCKEQKEVGDKDFLKADVVVTTIDQVVSMMTNHSRFGLIKELLNSAIVFDEFHEIIKSPLIAIYFKEIIGIINMSKNGRMLMMSATPNPMIVKFLFDGQNHPIVRMKSFHDKKFIIKILHDGSKSVLSHPFIKMACSDNSFMISNNIGPAQFGFLGHLRDEKDRVLVVHSSYTKDHKDQLIKKALMLFGKNGNHDAGVRSGPILQASLNISARLIHTDSSSPEDMLQRLGRCNRFCENDKGEFYIYDTSNNNSIKKYLSYNYIQKSTKLFLSYLEDKYGSQFETDLDTIYEDYFQFYRGNAKNCQCDMDKFEQDAYKKMRDSDFFKPVDFFIKKAHAKETNKLSSKSMRGTSIYVIPTNGKIKNLQFIESGWLYDPRNIRDGDQFLSVNVDDYRFYEIIDKFRGFIKHKQYLYGLDRYYNKHNTKTKYLIYKNARLPGGGIFIGDLSDKQRQENFGYDNNFTYIFDVDYKRNIFGVGLINKEELYRVLKGNNNE